MAKDKTITEQINDLVRENEVLAELERNFSKLCENYFGASAKKIKNILEKNEIFDEKICSYFNLNSKDKLGKFIAIMCTENTYNFFQKKLAGNDGEQG